MWPCVQTVWKLPWAKTGPVLAYWFDCIGPLLAENSAIIGPILARYKIVCWLIVYTINVETLVSMLTRQGRHKRDGLVTLRREKQGYCRDNPIQDQRGSNPGRMHDGRGICQVS